MNSKTTIALTIMIAFILITPAIFMLQQIGPNNGPNLVHSQHISNTASKSFNFSFIQDHNFTSGIGNWTNGPSGAWAVVNDEAKSTLDQSSQMFDLSKWTKDVIVSYDFIMPTGANNVSAGLEITLRSNGVDAEAEAGCTKYRVMLSGCGNPIGSFMGLAIIKYINGILQTNWYYPTSYTDYAGNPSIWGTNIGMKLYNNTWMRATAGIIGNNIFVTWGNLTGNNTNTISMAIMDIGTQISGGYIGFRSYHTLSRIRNIMYNYPEISIPLRAGQSATIHFTSNYSGYSYTGTPLKGVLSDNNWVITTTNADIGAYSQYFTMTNATVSITRKITLSVFPDVTVSSVWYDGPSGVAEWYPANPVLANQPGGMVNQLYDPSVILDSDGYLKMWLSVNEPGVGQRTYFFQSVDGISWETNGWTNPLTNPPLDFQKLSVIKVNGIYQMVINTMDWTSGIFYFTSTNGIDWTIQNGGNPIIIPSLPWEDGTLSSPWIIYWGDEYFVTYSVGRAQGGMYEPFAGGIAHGPSLLSLTKYPNPLRLTSYDSKGNFSYALGGVKPVRYGSSWIALTTGISRSTYSQLSLAMSDDLLNWTSYPDYPAFPRNVQSWAYSMTYGGSMVIGYGGNNLGFWFNGANATGKEQIGFVSWGFQMPPENQVHALVNLTLLMFALGVVVGPMAWVVKLTKLKKAPTIGQVINIVIFIIVGMSAVGIAYSMV